MFMAWAITAERISGIKLGSKSEKLRTSIMNAHRLETVIDQDGTLTLRDLPFDAGTVVEVVIQERAPKSDGKDRYPLRDKPLRYDDPTGPVAQPDWNALQ